MNVHNIISNTIFINVAVIIIAIVAIIVIYIIFTIGSKPHLYRWKMTTTLRCRSNVHFLTLKFTSLLL